MYEFHGWFGLADSTGESDTGSLGPSLVELRARLVGLGWATARAELHVLNGEHFLNVDGLVNRRRDEAMELDKLLGFLAERLPGSYGLLYERSDEDDMPTPPGPGGFRVRVLARGRIVERLDPFLSPVRPTIED